MEHLTEQKVDLSEFNVLKLFFSLIIAHIILVENSITLLDWGIVATRNLLSESLHWCISVYLDQFSVWLVTREIETLSSMSTSTEGVGLELLATALTAKERYYYDAG